VGEEQVQQVFEAAERIFVSLTGHTDFDRDLSQEILAVALTTVSAEQQEGYVRQLGAFAEACRERLVQLYGKYGPGRKFTNESHCYLTHQPGGVVVCEHWTASRCGSSRWWRLNAPRITYTTAAAQDVGEVSAGFGERRRRRPPALCRCVHRQLVPVWRRRTRHGRVLSLEADLGDGLSLRDLVVADVDLLSRTVASVFEDERLNTVLAKLAPAERAVVFAYAEGEGATWTEAASAVGAADPEAFGERVRRKAKRLADEQRRRAALRRTSAR
jgi:hypothetical protein